MVSLVLNKYFVRSRRDSPQTYSEEEQAALTQTQALLRSLPAAAFKDLPSPTPRVKMQLAFHLHAAAGARGVVKGWTIADSTPEECAAREFHKEMRATTVEFYDTGGVDRTITVHNEHAFTLRAVRRVPSTSSRSCH